MAYERAPQLTADQAHEQNHGDIVAIMGQLNAEQAASYRNVQPRTWELVGKQEELKAMLEAALDFWRSDTNQSNTYPGKCDTSPDA